MSNRKKIIVTGASGQLGSGIMDLAGDYPGLEFIFLTREQLPIDDEAAVRDLFEREKPAGCINAAAYTAVDKAETDREAAFRINAYAVGNLAAACSSCNAFLVHVSTDYVFPGKNTRPYREDDLINPVNTYGASKAEGEMLALKNNPDTYIIRTSWLYGRKGHNFVRTMQRLMGERDKLGVVNDQEGSPTNADDLAGIILKIITSPQKVAPGIYHFSNSGTTTWFGFASAIKELTGSSCDVFPVDTAAFPTPARRPAYSVMDTSKISTALGIRIPGWRESLEGFLRG